MTQHLIALSDKIAEAWKKFWDNLPPEIREKLDERVLLQSVLEDAAKEWADQEFERQYRGTGMENPVGIIGYQPHPGPIDAKPPEEE
jgi:hypothetical protein